MKKLNGSSYILIKLHIRQRRCGVEDARFPTRIEQVTPHFANNDIILLQGKFSRIDSGNTAGVTK